ncbi:hypothetical protein [Paraburkholderia bannensis]|uniref:hypothetical protein n=1 Tax=Paraburkholderia bannensis TaxID=765414 RepID=UPI002ABE985C|nr:hypothetical protein [Paraburkholderia bannensis]
MKIRYFGVRGRHFTQLPCSVSVIQARIIRIVTILHVCKHIAKSGRHEACLAMARKGSGRHAKSILIKKALRTVSASLQTHCFVARLNALRQPPTLSESAVTKSRHAF